MTFCFFEPLRVRNYCFPEMSMYAHLLRHLYRQHRAKKNAAMAMSFLHRRASMVSFIRPHPTVLVSVRGAAGENLVPMNLMGQLGERHFGFALRHDRWPAKIIERTLQLAISNVPLAQAPLAYSYAGHHTVESIRLSDLPFGVRCSARLKLSVPEFAQRVREFEVVRIHKSGIHTFFIARLLHDEVLREAPTLSVIHGYYQAWRLRRAGESATESIANDRFQKYGERLR
jgi:flavin reductase (DIM6/NTAB) family NADH-FMN oxidoreductase RutF